MLNAIEAMPDGGDIGVSARNVDLTPGNRSRLAPGPYVVLEVADCGTGMSEDVRKRIFDPYFRTQAARESSAPGTGLGMGIVRDIVEQHGGTLEVHSEQGTGTTVTMDLPADTGA